MRINVACEIEIDEELAGTTDLTTLCRKAEEFIRSAVSESTGCDDFISGPYRISPASVPVQPVKATKTRHADPCAILVPDAGANVELSELRAALDKIKPAISDKSSIPILRDVYIEPMADKLRIMGNNLEVSIELTIRAGIANISPFCVNYQDFRKAIKGAKGIMNIRIDAESSECTLSLGSRNMIIPTLPVEEYPCMPKFDASELTPAQDIPGLVGAIGNVSDALYTGEIREILTCIQMQSNRIVATDTHRLHIAQIDTELKDWIDIVIPGSVCMSLGKMLGASKTDSVSIRLRRKVEEDRAYADHAIFEHNGITVVTRLFEEQFPNIDEFIPSDCPGSWSVNPAQMIEALNGIAPLAKEYLNRIVCASEGDTLNISTAGSQGASSTSIPVIASGTMIDFRFAVNCEYLTDSLKPFAHAPMANISGAGDGPMQTYMLDSEHVPGTTVVLMPMRLDED